MTRMYLEQLLHAVGWLDVCDDACILTRRNPWLLVEVKWVSACLKLLGGQGFLI